MYFSPHFSLKCCILTLAICLLSFTSATHATDTVKAEQEVVSENEKTQDIEVCKQEGYAHAAMVNRPYVEHGGCWCKSGDCDYSPLCKGIANKKIKQCLIEKGWTQEAVEDVIFEAK